MVNYLVHTEDDFPPDFKTLLLNSTVSSLFSESIKEIVNEKIMLFIQIPGVSYVNGGYCYKNNYYEFDANNFNHLEIPDNLYDKVIDIEELIQRLNKQIGIIRSYMRLILNKCKTFNDIELMIPTNLYSRIKSIITPHLPIGYIKNHRVTISEADIAEFRTNNSELKNKVSKILLKDILVR